MKIIEIDTKPREPSLNMRLNEAYQQFAVKHDAIILRIYTHTPGIILGKSQSITDAHEENCKRDGLDIARRETGGAAVYVDPNTTLCYSLFAPLDAFGKTIDQTGIYKAFTFELAKNLGHPFAVGGTYYLQFPQNESMQAIAGHAIRIKDKSTTKSGFVQIDGMLHTDMLDADVISKYIHLRKLYKDGDNTYVLVGDSQYRIQNKTLSPASIPATATLIRDEKEELARLPTLKHTSKKPSDYVNALEATVKSLFGNFEYKQLHISPAPQKQIDVSQAKIAIGHCFIYMGETEDYGIMYQNKPN